MHGRIITQNYGLVRIVIVVVNYNHLLIFNLISHIMIVVLNIFISTYKILNVDIIK